MNFLKKLFRVAEIKSASTKTLVQPNERIMAPVEIKLTTSIGSRSSYNYPEPKFNPMSQDDDGNWILNPGAPFELTVLSTEKELVQQIRDLLDNDEIRDYRKDDKLAALFAERNVRIKEIEEYKDKYKTQYQNKIQELIDNSSEWAISGERDKEDLMIEFRQAAIKEIYERANCDLTVLFEYEPIDITLDDELIMDYGFENIQTYLRYADKLHKVRVIPKDNHVRPIFEKLAELGLAVRGVELPKDQILTTLTLKDLNAIAQNPYKEYKRKNQAIEYIVNLPDLDERLGKRISLRELFQLKALPDKYRSLNLQEIAKSWSYHTEEARLLIETFRNSYYRYRDFSDTEYLKGYTVEALDKENPCPCARDLEQQKFTKNSPPRVPQHIGCNCFLNKKYDFE